MKTTDCAALLSDLESGICEIKNRAQRHVAELDAKIHEINAKLASLGKEIPRDAFVRQVIEDVRRSVAYEKVSTDKRALGAAQLNAHFEMRSLQAVNGDGSPDYVFRPKRILNIFDHDTKATALIAALPDLFEPAIEAWAGRLADDLGLPKEGSIEDLQRRQSSLQAELEELIAARERSRASLSSIMEASLTPLLDEQKFLRMIGKLPPESVAQGPSGRPAGVYDADGNPQAAIGSDGYRRYWDHRHAVEAEEQARNT